MAYVKNGIITKKSRSGNENYIETMNMNTNNDNFALYVTFSVDKKYKVYAYPIDKSLKNKQCDFTYKTICVKDDGTKENIRDGKFYIDKYPSGYGLNSISLIDYSVYCDDVGTTLPMFSDTDEDSINAYITTGDTSGAIKDFSTKWTLYIDGKSNPLYKLTWNCDGLKDIDTSYTTISMWVGAYNVLDDTFNDDNGTKFKNVDYDKHSVKFSYSDLEKLVPQP